MSFNREQYKWLVQLAREMNRLADNHAPDNTTHILLKARSMELFKMCEDVIGQQDPLR